MKKLLDLNARSNAQVHQATTWSFYFEGERLFEGTRSLFTAGGVEKPVLNAYRMLGRLGDTRVAVQSSGAWSLDRLDDAEAAMREEIDALATVGGAGAIQVLVWRHADDQYAVAAGEADVTVRVERLPFDGDVRVSHTRIDACHSNSHAAWQALGRPDDPTDAQLRTVTERQGLEPYGPDRTETVRDGGVTLRIALPLPAVSLLEIRPSS
jgi:xylan 1,4-beta-xylosidase